MLHCANGKHQNDALRHLACNRPRALSFNWHKYKLNASCYSIKFCFRLIAIVVYRLSWTIANAFCERLNYVP